MGNSSSSSSYEWNNVQIKTRKESKEYKDIDELLQIVRSYGESEDIIKKQQEKEQQEEKEQQKEKEEKEKEGKEGDNNKIQLNKENNTSPYPQQSSSSSLEQSPTNNNKIKNTSSNTTPNNSNNKFNKNKIYPETKELPPLRTGRTLVSLR